MDGGAGANIHSTDYRRTGKLYNPVIITLSLRYHNTLLRLSEAEVQLYYDSLQFNPSIMLLYSGRIMDYIAAV